MFNPIYSLYKYLTSYIIIKCGGCKKTLFFYYEDYEPKIEYYCSLKCCHI